MEIKNTEELFKIFLKLYKEEKILFSWRKNSLGIMNTSNFEEEDLVDQEEFRNFVGELTNALKDKVLQKKINEKYDKYVNELLETDKDLKGDIITRCESNVDICNWIGLEILTKRNKDLEIECFSTLVNLNLQKPHLDEDLLEQVTFELSIKDLKKFHKDLGEAIENINKLNI